MTHYIAMWDMLGLETIFNVTQHLQEVKEHEKKLMWQILKDDKMRDIKPPSLPLQHMLLRARFNSQRCYEIYEFNSSMTIEEIREVFESDPQPIVEWIREHGHQVYSDYVKREKKMIV